MNFHAGHRSRPRGPVLYPADLLHFAAPSYLIDLLNIPFFDLEGDSAEISCEVLHLVADAGQALLAV